MSSDTNNINNIDANKIIAIFGYILILSSLAIIFFTSPVNRYEYSIYEAYKWYFWLFIISAHLIGIIILFSDETLKYESHFWVFGYFIIISSNLILLSLPFIRGYFIHGRHDVLTHIGYMVDIESTSHIINNSYPMVHILGFTIKSICNFNYGQISIAIPILFSMLYIFPWYFLGKELFNDKKSVRILLAFSSILLFRANHVLLSPNAETTLFIPFVLYLYLKSTFDSKKATYRFLLICTNIYVVFSHPLLTLLLIITFVIADYSTYKDSKINRRESGKLILIMAVIFFSWSTYTYTITKKVELVINALLFNTESQSEIGRYSSSVASTALSPLDLIQVYIYQYGQFFVLGILSIVSIYIILVSSRKYRWKMTYGHYFSIIGYIFFTIMSLFFLVTVDDFGFMRIYSYATFFSILLIPLAIHTVINKNGIITDKMYLKIFSTLVIISVFIIYASTFGMYYSPFSLKENQQGTANEYFALNKFYEVKNEPYPILECGIVNYRFYTFIKGTSQASEHHVRYYNNIIDHFGYDSNSSLKNNYNETSYILIDDIGKNKYIKLYPKDESKWVFVSEDFSKLNNDTAVIKFYSNVFFEIYKIK